MGVQLPDGLDTSDEPRVPVNVPGLDRDEAAGLCWTSGAASPYSVNNLRVRKTNQSARCKLSKVARAEWGPQTEKVIRIPWTFDRPDNAICLNPIRPLTPAESQQSRLERSLRGRRFA